MVSLHTSSPSYFCDLSDDIKHIQSFSPPTSPLSSPWGSRNQPMSIQHMLVKERNLFLKAALQLLDNNSSNSSVTINSNNNINQGCGFGYGNGLQSNLTDPNHPPQPYHQLPSSSLSPLPHGHHSQPIHTHQRGSGLHGKNSVNSMSSDGNDNRFLKILYTSISYIHTFIHSQIHLLLHHL